MTEGRPFRAAFLVLGAQAGSQKDKGPAFPIHVHWYLLKSSLHKEKNWRLIKELL